MNIVIYCQDCRRYPKATALRCQCGKPIKSLKNKRFAVDYRVNGKRVREALPEAENLRQAQSMAAKIKVRLDRGRHGAGNLKTLGDLRKWYFATPEIKGKKSKARDVYCWIHLEAGLGKSLPLKKLTIPEFDRYRRARLAEESRKGGKTKPATVNREHEVLRRAFNLAVKMRELGENPLAHLEKLPENNIRDRVITDEEMGRLLEHSPPLTADVCTLARYTGMREEEVMGLTWDEVYLDPAAPCISLPAHRTKEKMGKTIPLRIVKGGHVFDQAERVIRRQPRAIHTRRVFLLEGKPVDSIRTSFNTAKRNAKIKGFTFHDFRRTYANWMTRLGFSERVVMAITGHRTRVAFDRYRHVREDEVLTVAMLPEADLAVESGQHLDSKATG